MPTVRQLVMFYALAGVDCVDVAADPAVVTAARQGLKDAATLALTLGNRHHLLPGLPWLMVSLNDSDDPHFRKAYFDATRCPATCDRPCEAVCPTAAIQFQGAGRGGVVREFCYGCGRCLPLCPIGAIEAQPHRANPEAFPVDRLADIDAVEIHTQVGRQGEFAQLWQRLQPWRCHLKLISISCPDDDQIVSYLRDIYAIIAPLDIPVIWQTDGRPMSGDLGRGTTHAAIRLAQKVLGANLPGYIQLAGGTNAYTVSKLLELGLVKVSPTPPPGLLQLQGQPGSLSPNLGQTISGIAYGSYARTLLQPLLVAVDQKLGDWPRRAGSSEGQSSAGLATQYGTDPSGSATALTLVADNGRSSLLEEGIQRARSLVGQLKMEVPNGDHA